MSKWGWGFWLALALGIGGGLLTSSHAQPRPYVGYKVEGGCLYITAQGYAVFSGWGAFEDGVTCR